MTILTITMILVSAFANVSGRVAGVAVDPSDPSGNTIYVATGGGVWK